MNNRLTIALLFFLGILLFPHNSLSQKIGYLPSDDLGNVTDSFQEYFFEALKQKGIENYELALNALEKAEKEALGNIEYEAVVFFEMGKNHSKLKQYSAAEINFKKVLAWDEKRLDVMIALYDLYYKQKKYDAAIPLLIKLIDIDSDYKEDLANLYNRTHQYNKALTILDELDIEWGESNYRNALRSKIYRTTGNTSTEIKNLKTKIDNNLENEREYLKLIFLYSEEGESKKAFDTAKELLKQHPNSQLVHLALYKFYLEDEKFEEAIISMKIVFNENDIDKESKNRVLKDFLAFATNNPQKELDIEAILTALIINADSRVYKQVGDYYFSKGNKNKALSLYQIGSEKDLQNFGLLKSTIRLQLESNEFNQASKLSLKGLEVFPAQPILYLLNGIANNKMKNEGQAIESLETGLDYIFDDIKMEYDFYQQLSISYTLKWRQSKSRKVFKKG